MERIFPESVSTTEELRSLFTRAFDAMYQVARPQVRDDDLGGFKELPGIVNDMIEIVSVKVGKVAQRVSIEATWLRFLEKVISESGFYRELENRGIGELSRDLKSESSTAEIVEKVSIRHLLRTGVAGIIAVVAHNQNELIIDELSLIEAVAKYVRSNISNLVEFLDKVRHLSFQIPKDTVGFVIVSGSEETGRLAFGLQINDKEEIYNIGVQDLSAACHEIRFDDVMKGMQEMIASGDAVDLGNDTFVIYIRERDPNPNMYQWRKENFLLEVAASQVQGAYDISDTVIGRELAESLRLEIVD